jgi:hypothetical protein
MNLTRPKWEDIDLPFFITFLAIGFGAAWEHLIWTLTAMIILAVISFAFLMRKLSRQCSEIVASLTGTPSSEDGPLMKKWPGE